MTIQDRTNEAAEAVAHLPGDLSSPRTNAMLAIMIVQAIDRLTNAVERAANLVGEHDEAETVKQIKTRPATLRVVPSALGEAL